jgi:hypothetical protein
LIVIDWCKICIRNCASPTRQTIILFTVGTLERKYCSRASFASVKPDGSTGCTEESRQESFIFINLGRGAKKSPQKGKELYRKGAPFIESNASRFSDRHFARIEHILLNLPVIGLSTYILSALWPSTPFTLSEFYKRIKPRSLLRP